MTPIVSRQRNTLNTKTGENLFIRIKHFCVYPISILILQTLEIKTACEIKNFYKTVRDFDYEKY